jgi:hypothetical protein
MSVSMKVRLENAAGRPARLQNFEDLYAEKKSLDRAAKSAGVGSLFSFTLGLTAESTLAHRALGDPDVDAMSDAERERFYAEVERVSARVGPWHAAADGLKTVDALLAHRRSAGAVAAEGSVDHVLKDLRKVLAKAAKARRRFRLVGE